MDAQGTPLPARRPAAVDVPSPRVRSVHPQAPTTRVLVNQRTGVVVDGHARVPLALSRGEPTVPVLYVDLTPDEEALVLATLDPVGAMAGRDDEKMRAEATGCRDSNGRR